MLTDHVEHTLHTCIHSTTTYKTSCLFSVNALEVGISVWELRHWLDPQFSVHNHLLSHAATSHLAYS